LVLLHGIGLSRRAWGPVVPALAEHFDVLAIDLPGFGESEPMPPRRWRQASPTFSTISASTRRTSVLMSILREKLHDERFLRLIENLLKAGYLEQWTYHPTLSGCPQGSC
jgi:pimeloyl-ACP methyl ester carboxylesterase